MKNKSFLFTFLFFLIILFTLKETVALGGSEGVRVRVTSYDSINHIYNFSCEVPLKTNASDIGPFKYYDIDPTPSYYAPRHFFLSQDNNVTWHLDPDNFHEEIHSNAMYHIYCEVQNFSAPKEKENLASEFHIDLRKTHNQKDPNIYVLDSDGPRATLKCDPPAGTKRYSMSWALRSREGLVPLPELSDMRIVNITAPKATAGWDIVCDVFDKDTGILSHWDMPIEFFPEGPAYVPTIEGCLPDEPCTWVSSNGIPPNGTLIVNITLNSTPVQADVFINEMLKGSTSTSGFISIPNIIPGIYNLVIRKTGFEEISTLVPIASGKILYRNYSLKENTTEGSADECFSTVFSIPSSCGGGSITTDDASGCRTIICSNGTGNMRVQACNKPSNTAPQFFEMYKQAQNGSLVRQICLGSACIRDNGFAKSSSFPICTGNATPKTLNGSLRVSTSPNFVDIFLNNISKGNSGLLGSLTIDNLVPGQYQLKATKENHTDNITQITILEGQLINIQVKLAQIQDNGPNITNTSNTSNESKVICYTSLKDIPSNCSMGIITQDASTSGRTIVCSNGADSMKIQAWEKPDIGTKQYFEMYRQSQIGTTSFEICIGSVCIKDNGYAKSANYPICVSKENRSKMLNLSIFIFTNPDAEVYLNDSLKGTTNSAGQFSILGLIQGIYELLIEKINYFSYNNVIELIDQNISIAVNLTEIPANNTNSTNNTFDNSTNATLPNLTNFAPNPPIWLEPSQNKTNMDPFDFHLQVFPMNDTENGKHIASDFEIWDDESNERVWSALFTKVLEHIHNADGIFENNLAGKNSLLYDHKYRVRSRFYENAAVNNASNWSEWRFFRTKLQFNITSNFSWTAQPGYKAERVASNISFPVNIHMVPKIYTHLPLDEQPLLYVTQLYGQIGMIKRNGQYIRYADNLLNYFPGSLPGTGESGVVGIYVDNTTGDLFVSLVYVNESDSLLGKVIRFITNDDGTSYTNSLTILDKIPVDYSHQVHTISRGPDGKLYLSAGDANSLGGASLDKSKDPNAMSGKILRFNDDGSIPSDNPYPGTYTYAGGFRNPFGHAWKPGTNELFATNNGPDSDDGIYRIFAGDIFGWCCNTAIGTWYLWKNTTAPTALAFNPGINGFPHETNGNLFVALSGPTYKPGPDKDGKRIVKFTLQPNGSVASIEDFVVYTGTGYSAPIGVAFGDDGLYFTDIYGKLGITSWPETSGNIYRVVQGNQTEDPEETIFSAALGPARWFPQGLDVVWECKADGGSGKYMYSYTFGDGSSFQNTNRSDVFHRYPANGTYEASCTVLDLEATKSAAAASTITLGTVPSQQSVTNGSLLINSVPNFTNVFLNDLLKGTTDINGKLLVQNIVPASYNLKITKSNYINHVQTIMIASNQTLEVNATLSKLNQTCYSSVQDMPASCTNGIITSDSFSGCRTIVCSNNAENMRILACNKPDAAVPEFFEMYKQFQNGTTQFQICIGSTCIKDNGYAKSQNYPVCV